ncbi:MAG: PIN domain-containing protein [Methanococci archaeon]|nr:PIN domain-containing protein [Methanococci archaeon]
MITKYRLLPNDDLILTTSKHYKIKNLITLDNNFKWTADKEEIKIINSK